MTIVALNIDLSEWQTRDALNRVLSILCDHDDDELVDEVTIAIVLACGELPLGALAAQDGAT